MVMMLSKKTQGILDGLAAASSETTGDAQVAIASAIIRLRTLDAAYEGSKRRREELEEEVARLKWELDEALMTVRVLTEQLDEHRRDSDGWAAGWAK